MIRTATNPPAMKTTNNPPSSAPPMHAGKRHVSGSTSYPQWMRTLEEKYQKLHQKITNNTMITHKYQNLTGKPVYDVRVARALAKYRDIAKGKVPPNKTPEVAMVDEQANMDTPEDYNAEVAYDDERATQDTGWNESKEQTQQEENCLDRVGKLISANGSNTDQAVDEEIRGINNADGELCATQHCKSSQQRQTTICDREIDAAADNSDKGGKSDDDGSSLPDKTVRNTVTKSQAKSKQEIHSVTANRRNVSTSLSRVSRNTTKSCPAKIESKKGVKSTTNSTHIAVPQSKSASKTKREKMFNKMSVEAQHAITETIQEMNIARSKTAVGPRESGVNFVPSRTRKCVKSWTHQSKVDERNNRSKLTTSELIEQASKSKTEKREVVSAGAPFIENIEQQVFDTEPVSKDFNSLSSHGSLSDIAGSVQTIGNNSKLPDIQKDNTTSARDRLSSKSQHFRIPGIGKYDVKVKVDDFPFEITPPGFDSRYNDLEPIEDRESETPPPDIRQRAIDKCSEWLLRHGNR